MTTAARAGSLVRLMVGALDSRQKWEQTQAAVYCSNCGISALVFSESSDGSFVLLVHPYDISTEQRA
jgi:hypothetical protein